jgi:hypothetical protein
MLCILSLSFSMPSVVLQRLTAGAAEQQNQKKKKQAALANSGEWMIVPNDEEHSRACRTPTGPKQRILY